MTDKDYIKIFEINTDAIAVNRGFYYQYLVTLKKWIYNYIHKKNSFIFCEVDDDIMEVENKLIFTQVKCYTKSFSLRSEEIKKTLFNFFVQFLKNEQSALIEYCFSTNTGIAKTEKLLKAWTECPELTDIKLANQVLKKIKEILNSEINKHKRKKLEKKYIDRNEKEVIKYAAEQIKTQVVNLKVDSFPKCIKWEFLDYDPNSAIDLLFKEIRKLLSHEIFKNRPISLIENAFLSEIFRCSQLQDRKKRILSNSRIDEILNETDSKIKECIDDRLISLLGIRLEEIQQNFKAIHIIQNSFEKRMNSIEDKIISNTSENNYPKNITLIPKSINDDFYGRKESIEFIRTQLDETHYLCINGNGGMGKTFLVQNYVKQFSHQYDHIAWINSSPNLSQSILLDAVLFQNLKLDFTSLAKDGVKIDIVCNGFQCVKGNNLLIIDNYENDLGTLKKIIFQSSWKVIVTTRERIPGVINYTLPKIDINSASKIFTNYSKENTGCDDKLLLDFFDYIDYNPLVIKLCAQTITNSIDLTLESLFLSIKEQNLDDENIEIEVNIADEDYPLTILAYLSKKFEFKNLTRNEEIYLEFLALLPTEDVKIKEIALIGGKESYKKNLKDFTNWTNSLHNKGWIERVDGEIRMYRLVQELINYNSRKQENAFITNMFLINWLFHRIDEVAQSNPTLSLPFLKYAESILKTIKEEYRDSMYQPLLMLENALLNSYNWIENTEKLHLRWIDLGLRAEKYLSKDDINLGVIFNNVGYSYARRKKIDTAIEYFDKSLLTLKKQEEKSIDVLLNSLNNMTQAYLVLGKLPLANKVLNNAHLLIKKYQITNKQFIAANYFLNALYLMESNDIIGAAEKYELAIQTHLKINKDSRNDFLLMMYYTNLILMLFKLDQSDKVIENIDKINTILEGYKMNFDSALKNVKIMVDNISEYYKIRE